MKIGQRLALRFTLVSALLTGGILVITFFITRGVVHTDFVERLSQQTRLEVIHYATAAVNGHEVIDSTDHFLFNPSIAIFSEDGKEVFRKGDFDVPKTWVAYLQKHQVFNAERGDRFSVGRQYAYQGTNFLVFVSAKNASAEHELEILMKAMVAGWVVSLVLSYLAGLYFSGKALQPVKRVVSDVNKITEDNLSYRLTLDKDISRLDEIDELILTFNALLNRIESAFIAQKRFVQDASHELKTPLTAIMAEAELALAKDRDTENYKRSLSVILTETERLVSTTQGLLTLTRLEEGSFKTELTFVDVLDVCERTIQSIMTLHTDRKIEFKTRPISLFVYGNRQLLEIALMNIIDNAIKYSAREIKLDVRKADKQIFVSVTDQGLGIPASDLEKIKSPLYRGSNVTLLPGAGLGLSLVDRIINVLNGKFEIHSEEGKGTTCVIMLPATEPN